MKCFSSGPAKVSAACLVLLGLSLSLALALSGCGPGGGPAAPKADGAADKAAGGGDKAAAGIDKAGEAVAPGGAAAAVDPATAGSITGKVNWKGNKPPKPPPIMMAADPNCSAMHSGPVYPDDVVINDNNTVKWIFVHVSKGLEGKTFPVPAAPVVFDQRGCRYEPHVFGIQAKQKLDILNSDTTSHNVHFLPKKNPEINASMPTKGMKLTKSLSRPESPVKIKCEVHPWMVAWCHVMTHPYFSVTGDQGTFEIKNLPPGKYTLTAWHEKYGEKKVDVEVAPKESKTADFEYKG